MFRNHAQRSPRSAAAVWFALAAILPGIIALAVFVANGGTSLDGFASMYPALANPPAFTMLFVSRGLKGEEYMWLLMVSPLISAAIPGLMTGRSILAGDPLIAGQRGIITAYLAYFINGIISMPLVSLVVQGTIQWGEMPGLIRDGLMLLVLSILLPSVVLIPLGYGSGYLLHRICRREGPHEEIAPVP